MIRSLDFLLMVLLFCFNNMAIEMEEMYMLIKKNTIAFLAFLFLIFGLSACNLNSKKGLLATFNFHLTSKELLIGSYENPIIEFFTTENDLINYFNSSDEYSLGPTFFADIDAFKKEYGFDSNSLIYFSQVINVEDSVIARLEVQNNELNIIFNYDRIDSDIYLPAETEFHAFYILPNNKTYGFDMIHFKLGEYEKIYKFRRNL